jgi:hypothetical protein
MCCVGAEIKEHGNLLTSGDKFNFFSSQITTILFLSLFQMPPGPKEIVILCPHIFGSELHFALLKQWKKWTVLIISLPIKTNLLRHKLS